MRKRRDFLVLGSGGQFQSFNLRVQLVDFLVGGVCLGAKSTDFLQRVSSSSSSLLGWKDAGLGYLFELVHDLAGCW